MRHRHIAAAILITALVILAPSCSRDSNTVSGLQVQPYVRISDGDMGLSLYMMTSTDSDDTLQMVVTSPDGRLTWTFSARYTNFAGTVYAGNPDIRMPAGASLPKGTWKVDVLFRDGTTITKDFAVDYEDAYVVPENLEEAVYDSSSNITFLP